LGTLNQGRRKQKALKILKSNNLLNLLIFVIIVRVNVLICEHNPTRGNPTGSGFKKVSIKGLKSELQNEILLLGATLRSNQNRLVKNINKDLKRLKRRLEEVLSSAARWIIRKSNRWKILLQISCLFLLLKFNKFLVNERSEAFNPYTYHKQEHCTKTSKLKIATYNSSSKLIYFQCVRLLWLSWILTIVSSNQILSLIIYLELLKQNVEANPGMNIRDKSVVIPIITYNCNGLGDKKKLKRLLLKVGPKVEKGAIVLLQETHLKDTKYFEMLWKHNFESNCISTNSAGVIILYSKEYKITESFHDKQGRNIIIAIEKGDTMLIISNSYFPNDHKEATIFAEEMFLKLLDFQHKFPEHQTISGGDFNVCLNNNDSYLLTWQRSLITINDSLNRNSTTNEKCLADSICSNNKITNLVDAFRSLHKVGGYTWKRGICYSRLDYIFISTPLIAKLVKAECNWAFETSDHAAVQIKLKLEEAPKKGPGIIKVNTKILENPKISKEIGDELELMMLQTDQTWSPHTKLEFLKVAIRSVFSSKIGEVRKTINLEVKDLEEEINQMEQSKQDILNSGETEINGKTEKLDIAINKLKATLVVKRYNFVNYQTFKTTAKWFEYGEKSNKFFLSLMKSRQNQKLISKIRHEDREYVGQAEVTSGITNFYRDLYARRDMVELGNDDFYKHCPKLSDEQAKSVDATLTNLDLLRALKTCKDSAPGPDGIPYSVYKKYWKIAGPIILDSWIYSVEKQCLPQSHYESAITLLPKEGKDTSDIKNWRPITLSNCDSKIITKALSIKISKVLDSIIDVSQTAYVPGRSVADNLRSNFFFRNHCVKKSIDAVLISLDAKKAFDSVDHRYIEDTLRAYGFGLGFINIFKVLYKYISARILINGYQSESIKIERGVKQGDALSCAIFIICIDPLLRNLNQSNKIKEISIGNSNIKFKAGAYADDVSIICRNNLESIQEVFNEYNRLSERSGLVLNAEKTEILRLNKKQSMNLKVKYTNKDFNIETVNKLKICGLYYCNDTEEEYELNVKDKIRNLSYKIKKWIPRNLTIEGKILIVKTFGLSQLIYNMQSVRFLPPEIINAEREIFKFIWLTNEKQNGIDRISRSIMKNDYENGGMKVPDIECLDRSLKLRQVVRAQNSNHVISRIQTLALGHKVNEHELRQEYCNITDKEDLCSSAQETLNIIIDYNRNKYQTLEENEYGTDKNLINEVASINMETFLKRKGRVFSLCILKPITKLGIITLGELVQTYEHVSNRNLNKSMAMVIKSFPKILVDIAKCFNDELNEIDQSLRYIETSNNKRLAIESITTREYQATLQIALNRVEKLNYKTRLEIDDFNEANILIFRRHCKNAKLRNIYFRLIHNDFFTHSRMKRYKMVATDKCPRCTEIETTKHLLWECHHVKHIWGLYNSYVTNLGMSNNTVGEYKQIYEIPTIAGLTNIKIKLIQALIQIRRPTNWDCTNIETLINDLVNTERHNFKTNHLIPKFEKKWNFVLK
jgi:exonuclease III